jgi:hypothetical protein
VGLAMGDVGIIYGHLTYFTAIWYVHSLWRFGKCYGYLVYFSHFGMLHQEKSGNPGEEEDNDLFPVFGVL